MPEPKLYIQLYNGRTHPDQELDDWGSEGPVIGPFKAIQWTYGHFKLYTDDGEQQFMMPYDGEYILYQGVYYGDFNITAGDGDVVSTPFDESENTGSFPLTIAAYSKQASKTAMYPNGKREALYYTALGLGEAGEVQGKIKKILRGDPQAQTLEYREEVAKEVGDVLWYCSEVCKALGTSLEDVAENNLAKLKKRAEEGKIQGAGDNR